MTIYGTSAGARNGRNGVEEWNYIDNVVKGLNGGYGHKARRSYDTAIPGSFNNCTASNDVGKRISAFSFHAGGGSDAGWNAVINGSYDAAIRNFVNSVPSGHKMYLIYSHEPENDGGNPELLWRKAWARFAKVVLDCGNSNVTPTFNLMAYTWDTSSRNPDNYNPAREMTSAEAAACLGTVDAYTRPVDGLFTEPYNAIMSWGFRGFGVMETGQADDPSIASWMLDVEDWIDAHPLTEIICWWHSGFAGSEQFWLDTTQDGLETWADIIGRNQGASIPVTQPPVVVLPPSSGTGNPTGTPVVGSGNTGGYGVTVGAAAWTGPLRVSVPYEIEPGWADDMSHSPVVASQPDGTGLVVWQDNNWDPIAVDYRFRLVAAVVDTTGTVSGPTILYTSTTGDTPGFLEGFPMGSNVLYTWGETNGGTDSTKWWLVGPDLTILASTSRTHSSTSSPFDTELIKMDDSTLLWTIGPEAYDVNDTPQQVLKVDVTTSSISFSSVTSDLQSILGSHPDDPIYLWYSPTDGVGIAYSHYLGLRATSGASVPVYTWTWNGTSISLGSGPTTLTDGIYDFDSASQFIMGHDGYLYFLPSGFESGGFIATTTMQRFYRVNFAGTVPSVAQLLDLRAYGERPPRGDLFYYQAWMMDVLSDSSAVWSGEAWYTDVSMKHADDVYAATPVVTSSSTMTDPFYPFGNGIYSIKSHDNGLGSTWTAYWQYAVADDTTNYVGVYHWGAALALPDLDGELTEQRRKFARGPTDYTG